MKDPHTGAFAYWIDLGYIAQSRDAGLSPLLHKLWYPACSESGALVYLPADCFHWRAHQEWARILRLAFVVHYDLGRNLPLAIAVSPWRARNFATPLVAWAQRDPFLWLAKSRIGGITGDCVGMVVEIVEVVGAAFLLGFPEIYIITMKTNPNHITLILGGARSGKSSYAQSLAEETGNLDLYCHRAGIV